LAAASTQSDLLDELNTVNVTLPGKTPADTVAAGYATWHTFAVASRFSMK
jgi:hypothetical protein